MVRLLEVLKSEIHHHPTARRETERPSGIFAFYKIPSTISSRPFSEVVLKPFGADCV
jgi:hypothetical protein